MAIKYDWGRGAAGVSQALMDIRRRKALEEEREAQRQFQDEQRRKRLADQLFYHRQTLPPEGPPAPTIDVDYGDGNVLPYPQEDALALSRAGFAPSPGAPMIGPPAPGDAIKGVWRRPPSGVETPDPTYDFEVPSGPGAGTNVTGMSAEEYRKWLDQYQPESEDPPRDPLYYLTRDGQSTPMSSGTASSWGSHGYEQGSPVNGVLNMDYVGEEPQIDPVAAIRAAEERAGKMTERAFGKPSQRMSTVRVPIDPADPSKGTRVGDVEALTRRYPGGALANQRELDWFLSPSLPSDFETAAIESLTTDPSRPEAVLRENIYKDLDEIDKTTVPMPLPRRWRHDDHGTPDNLKDDTFRRSDPALGSWNDENESVLEFFRKYMVPQIGKDEEGSRPTWQSLIKAAKLYGLTDSDISSLSKAEVFQSLLNATQVIEPTPSAVPGLDDDDNNLLRVGGGG